MPILDRYRSFLVRRTPIALLTAGLLVSLAACTPGDGTTDGAPEGCLEPGDASQAIGVDGPAGAAPEITFEAPLDAESTQRSLILEGDGARAEDGDTVLIEYTVFNGETGDELASTGFTGENAEAFPIDTASQQLVGFSLLLECAAAGDRIAGVIPPIDGFGEAGVPELQLSGTESLVFVIDVVEILDAPLDRAEGAAGELPDGFPDVTLADDDGAPTIVIPDEAPPAEFGLAVLIQGEGPVVDEGAEVTVHYTGINWNTGEVFDSSWQRGAPATFPTSGVIPGFRDALVGQAVGSQVIAIIPPDLGYGPQGGTPDGSIGAEDTIVFVVDILGTR
ncbi:MAG: FKBP-type peptidyl-prolyl cis-trans isomerase [Microcella sp.]|uniref:FKBP-type peptidyl-prolyl cis-trans isomerase n=1 Tax=Microcella sp. TaxID=1913979 RepID=UPI003314D5DD